LERTTILPIPTRKNQRGGKPPSRIDEEQRRSRKIRPRPGLTSHPPARPHTRTADKTGRYIGAQFRRDLLESCVLWAGPNTPKPGQLSHCRTGDRKHVE